MNKDQLLDIIQQQKKKLDNWQGAAEGTLEVAKDILKVVEDSVSGTKDLPIYRAVFDKIGKNLPSRISSNRHSYPHFLNQATTILDDLAPLSLPDSVNTLRENSRRQEELLTILENTIEEAKDAINKQEGAAEKQKQKHQEEMDRISKSHNEQLEFEVPLRTWVKASGGYNRKGVVFLRLLIGLTVFSGLALTVILLQTPDKALLLFSAPDKSAAIRWSFTFVILIGFLAYAIRAVVKAMFSSFHLARDADERALLTKYYLGLIRKGALEPEDRAIIMQSLFSRSDTGLLKEDGAPTMAGDVIAKMKSRQ